MPSRREFLRSTAAGLGTLAAAHLPLWAAEPAHPIGVQLYTVREQAEKDLPGVLAQIAEIGYQQVESYPGVYNRPAAELRRIIQDHGLTAPSAHFGYDDLETRLDYARELGVKYATCSMLPRSMWSPDGFRKAAEQFNRLGERCRKNGMRLAFHNHNYEFRQISDTTGWDLLVKNSDPALLFFEIDCYWVAQAGLDPATMIRALGGRVRMLHLKDRKGGFPSSQDMGPGSAHFTEVGAGTLDWKAIFSAAKQAGVEYELVERDSGDLPAMESLRISFRNLQRMAA